LMGELTNKAAFVSERVLDAASTGFEEYCAANPMSG